VKVVASGQKKQEVAQRRTVFAGLAAAVVAAAIAPKQAQAEERSSETVSRLCSSNPTCKRPVTPQPHTSSFDRSRFALSNMCYSR
jgi:hypothetical protein